MRRPRLRRLLRSEHGFEGMVAGNRVTLLHDGEQCFPAMLQAIEEAQEEVLLEMYWFGDDAIGMQFARALSEKARQGIRVCVSYDSVGSFAGETMFDGMRAAGCEVLEYNPIAPWKRRFNIGLVNNRNHRKMLIVDGIVGMTGGVNIGLPWASEDDGGLGWRDDMVRVEGPAVSQMRDVFVSAWRELGGADLPRITQERMSRGSIPTGASAVRVLTNTFGRRLGREIRRVYLARIARATRNVFITNSYFVPDRIVRRALARAAKRGVDVRVIVPGDIDIIAVQYAARKLYGWLMKRGIKLYEWQGTILHSKSAVVDGRWCTVGSYNLDWRSWRFNLELNVEVEDEVLAGAVAARFESDLEGSSQIDPHNWRFRPISERLLEHFFYLFRKLF